MSQGWTIFAGAILIGVITVAVGALYVRSQSSKLPENHEYIQLFASGTIVGGFISYLVSSGFLYGPKMLGMMSSDVKSTLKDLGLRGGDETLAVAAAAPAVTTGPTQVAQMVGGFFKSLGLDGGALQELNVGMPSF